MHTHTHTGDWKSSAISAFCTLPESLDAIRRHIISVPAAEQINPFFVAGVGHGMHRRHQFAHRLPAVHLFGRSFRRFVLLVAIIDVNDTVSRQSSQKHSWKLTCTAYFSMVSMTLPSVALDPTVPGGFLLRPPSA